MDHFYSVISSLDLWVCEIQKSKKIILCTLIRSVDIFVMVVVNNFQSLNEELVMKREIVGKFEEITRVRKNLSFEISRQHFNMKKAR